MCIVCAHVSILCTQIWLLLPKLSHLCAQIRILLTFHCLTAWLPFFCFYLVLILKNMMCTRVLFTYLLTHFSPPEFCVWFAAWSSSPSSDPLLPLSRWRFAEWGCSGFPAFPVRWAGPGWTRRRCSGSSKLQTLFLQACRGGTSLFWHSGPPTDSPGGRKDGGEHFKEKKKVLKHSWAHSLVLSGFSSTSWPEPLCRGPEGTERT